MNTKIKTEKSNVVVKKKKSRAVPLKRVVQLKTLLCRFLLPDLLTQVNSFLMFWFYFEINIVTLGILEGKKKRKKHVQLGRPRGVEPLRGLLALWCWSDQRC